MMKRFFLSFCLVLACISIEAQNVQLHYDFGRGLYNELNDRPLLTSTVEFFHPDSFGTTFFFVDMNYARNGVVSAYSEIERQISFSSSCPINWQIEYNGGVHKNAPLNNAYLTGLAYNYSSKKHLAGFTVSALYKYIQKNSSPQSVQFASSWYLHTSNKVFSFTGFADVWREKTDYGLVTFLTEPQFWLNLQHINGFDERVKLSIGSEVKCSYNFEGRDGFYCIPTLAMKWTFN